MNTYVFDSGTKKNIFIAFGIGVVFLILGVLFFGNKESHDNHATNSHATHETVAEAKAKHRFTKLQQKDMVMLPLL
jgi:hypothetical protein